MEITTTLELAAEKLATWKDQARTAPQRGPQAAVRRRVRDLEILLSITAKRASEAQRAAEDLATWLAAQEGQSDAS